MLEIGEKYYIVELNQSSNRTKTIYTHKLNINNKVIKSPLDLMENKVHL